VACAGGRPVLSAGEITLERGPDGWEVTSVTNQSTGYCPEGSSWPAVGQALDRIGVPHPGWFTDEFTFRRCPRSGERNLVRDGDFTCALCDAHLPGSWNFDDDITTAESPKEQFNRHKTQHPGQKTETRTTMGRIQFGTGPIYRRQDRRVP
jgi:hypothetical protein